jgi:uncharacterized protein (DUF1684 family)
MKSVPVVIIIAFTVLACDGKPPSQSDYVERIRSARVAKDAAFRKSAEPVPASLKDRLLPLVYYLPDSKYDVPAVLRPSGDSTSRQMVYSDGAIRDVRRVGTLEFTLEGQPYSFRRSWRVARPV